MEVTDMQKSKDAAGATEAEVEQVFEKISAEYGVTATATISEEPDLKLKWVRSVVHSDDDTDKTWKMTWLVPDYLVGAPLFVAEDVARVTLSRIFGDGTVPVRWSEDTAVHLSSEEYAQKWQDTYIERHAFIRKGLVTKFRKFLAEAEKTRPVPKGVVALYSSTEFSVSTSMRVIGIPSKLRGATEEALWFAFDMGLRAIDEGVTRFRTGGMPAEPFVTVDLTPEDVAMLVSAGVPLKRS